MKDFFDKLPLKEFHPKKNKEKKELFLSFDDIGYEALKLFC